MYVKKKLENFCCKFRKQKNLEESNIKIKYRIRYKEGTVTEKKQLATVRSNNKIFFFN